MPFGPNVGSAEYGICVNCGGAVKIHRRWGLFDSIKGGTCVDCGATYRMSQAIALQPRPGFKLPRGSKIGSKGTDSFCTRCGKPTGINDQFCSGCGTRLA